MVSSILIEKKKLHTIIGYQVFLCNTNNLYKNASWAGAIEYTDCITAEEQDSLNGCRGYGTKQSDVDVPVTNNPSLPLLPSPFWPGVLAPDMVLSVDQIEQNCVLTLN